MTKLHHHSGIVVVGYYRRLFPSASVKTLICHIKMHLSNSNMPSLADKWPVLADLPKQLLIEKELPAANRLAIWRKLTI